MSERKGGRERERERERERQRGTERKRDGGRETGSVCLYIYILVSAIYA